MSTPNLLRLPKEIQSQIYQEYFALSKWDLAVSELETLKLRRFPQLPTSLLLVCRKVYQLARNERQRSHRGYTGRIFVSCPTPRAGLDWFANKGRPFLEGPAMQRRLRDLTTAVAIPEYWIADTRENYQLNAITFQHLAATFPNMNTFEIVLRGSDIVAPYDLCLSGMLLEWKWFNAYYVHLVFDGVTHNPPGTANTKFQWITSYLVGKYAECWAAQDPDASEPNDCPLECPCQSPTSEIVFNGDIAIVWEEVSASTRQPPNMRLKMTKRIAYNVDERSAEPENHLAFRTSELLAWSCRMSLEEVEELDQAAWDIDEQLRRNARNQTQKPLSWQYDIRRNNRTYNLERVPLRSKRENWKPDSVLKAESSAIPPAG